MFGIDSMETLDNRLNELYDRPHPPKLYGILMCQDDRPDGTNVLIGKLSYYDLKSGSKFHVLVPGWNFDPDKPITNGPKFAQNKFVPSVFAGIEHAIKARLSANQWSGYNGGYQLIIIGKDSLGTNWLGAVVINIDKIIEDNVFANVDEAFNEIINLAITHVQTTPQHFYSALVSSNRFKNIAEIARKIAIELVAATVVKLVREP
jgi:hypothetical protein